MRAEERKQKVRSELRRIYRVLRLHSIDLTFRPLTSRRGLYGLCEASEKGGNSRVHLDPFKMMVATFVHEVYHHLEPRARHARIDVLEDFIVWYASPRQMKNLFRRLIGYWRLTSMELQGRYAAPPCPFCGRRLSRSRGPAKSRGRPRSVEKAA